MQWNPTSAKLRNTELDLHGRTSGCHKLFLKWATGFQCRILKGYQDYQDTGSMPSGCHQVSTAQNSDNGCMVLSHFLILLVTCKNKEDSADNWLYNAKPSPCSSTKCLWDDHSWSPRRWKPYWGKRSSNDQTWWGSVWNEVPWHYLQTASLWPTASPMVRNCGISNSAWHGWAGTLKTNLTNQNRLHRDYGLWKLSSENYVTQGGKVDGFLRTS